MGKNKITAIIVLSAVILTVIGYNLAHKNHSSGGSGIEGTTDAVRSTRNAIRYYTCGMHPSVRITPEAYDKGQKNCPICNMDLIAVYAEEQSSVTVEGEEDSSGYYGCGVGTEGKCPHCDMGMADAKCICGGHSFMMKGKAMNCPICGKPLRKLTPLEADRAKGVVSRVTVKSDQAALAGVMTESVRRLRLFKEIRTVGKIAYDPALAVAEEEYITAIGTLDKMEEGAASEIKERQRKFLGSVGRKLELLGLSREQIEELKSTREARTNYLLPDKKMWVYGSVYEYEMSWVKVGEHAVVRAASFPGEEFHGVVSSINPVLDPKTRSVTFRVEVDNPELKLKPEMYVDIVIMSSYSSPSGEKDVLAVPKSAVLNTGTRNVVWVDSGSGKYEGRAVEIGPEAVSSDGTGTRFYPVIGGLTEGEKVVTKANFLIDSQSQLTGSAAAAYGGALGAGGEKAQPAHQH